MIEFNRESYLPKMADMGAGYAPTAPIKMADCGIDPAMLLDQSLRTAYLLPQFTTEQMAAKLHLPHTLSGELLEQLRKDNLLEVQGQEGHFSYRYCITSRGRERAERLMQICGYTGPAPVSLEAYRAMLEWQAEQNIGPSPEDVKALFSELVLPDDAIHTAGLAVSSGRSLFVSGPPGNGKTTLGHLLNKAAGADIWIPYCIAVDNFNVIRLFDTHCHEIVAHDPRQPIDKRWVKIRRPFIVAGGEMTLASLDLAYIPALRYYEAPLHMKANGGTFLIDDFGRQQVAPDQLLNRWIIPLEHHIDFLTLHSGQKIQVPFLLMLIIATNLDPRDVTDPAFLRRIGYRIEVNAPTPESYAEIFRQYARRCGVAEVDEGVIALLLENYRSSGRELRACEPRDLILRAGDICRYHGRELALTDDIVMQAWNGYFGMV
jgi:predicted ATPase with chaperone activity